MRITHHPVKKMDRTLIKKKKKKKKEANNGVFIKSEMEARRGRINEEVKK